jgi:hypothetical protein
MSFHACSIGKDVARGLMMCYEFITVEINNFGKVVKIRHYLKIRKYKGPHLGLPRGPERSLHGPGFVAENWPEPDHKF